MYRARGKLMGDDLLIRAIMVNFRARTSGTKSLKFSEPVGSIVTILNDFHCKFDGF